MLVCISESEGLTQPLQHCSFMSKPRLPPLPGQSSANLLLDLQKNEQNEHRSLTEVWLEHNVTLLRQNPVTKELNI